MLNSLPYKVLAGKLAAEVVVDRAAGNPRSVPLRPIHESVLAKQGTHRYEVNLMLIDVKALGRRRIPWE